MADLRPRSGISAFTLMGYTMKKKSLALVLTLCFWLGIVGLACSMWARASADGKDVQRGAVLWALAAEGCLLLSAGSAGALLARRDRPGKWWHPFGGRPSDTVAVRPIVEQDAPTVPKSVPPPSRNGNGPHGPKDRSLGNALASTLAYAQEHETMVITGWNESGQCVYRGVIPGPMAGHEATQAALGMVPKACKDAGAALALVGMHSAPEDPLMAVSMLLATSAIMMPYIPLYGLVHPGRDGKPVLVQVNVLGLCPKHGASGCPKTGSDGDA